MFALMFLPAKVLFAIVCPPIYCWLDWVVCFVFNVYLILL